MGTGGPGGAHVGRTDTADREHRKREIGDEFGEPGPAEGWLAGVARCWCDVSEQRIVEPEPGRLLADPEAYNIIVPEGVTNEFAPEDEESWEDGEDEWVEDEQGE